MAGTTTEHAPLSPPTGVRPAPPRRNPVHSLAARAREHFHEQRAELFLRLMRPAPGMRVLDLGSGWGDPFMARVVRRVPLDVTLTDLTEGSRDDAERLGFHAVLLREGEPLPFADHEFDIVLCNSVIEHVTLPKEECRTLILPEREWRERALRSQRAFAAEIQRVGKRYFVQTPHKHFPLDLHTWLPLTNFLHHKTLQIILPMLSRLWVKPCEYADWNLLGPSEMRELLPGSRIWVERVAGLPKSVVAYR